MFRILSGLVASLILASSQLGADTIHFAGVPTYVTCYDTQNDVNFGDTWQANLLTLDQAAAAGYFSGPQGLLGYEEVSWLKAQSYGNAAGQVGLQHAVWQIFGTADSTPESTAYMIQVNAAAAQAFAGFDFSNFRFLEQVEGVAGASGTEQALVFQTSSTRVSATAATPVSAVPEPGSFSLWISAIGVVILLRRYSKTGTSRRGPEDRTAS